MMRVFYSSYAMAFDPPRGGERHLLDLAEAVKQKTNVAFYDLWLETLAFNTVSTLTIGSSAFYRCDYINSINFIGTNNNNNNMIINSSAFAECTILNNVTILPTILSFAPDAFSGCDALQNSSLNGTVNTSAIPNQISNYFSVANGFYVTFNIIP